MRKAPSRVQRDLKLHKGRIIRVEQDVRVLEDRVDRLENENRGVRSRGPTTPAAPSAPPSDIAQLKKENAELRAEIARLRESVTLNTKEIKQNRLSIAGLTALQGPVVTLVRSFKQTPGAPFEGWRSWMLSTFRKQGTYRKHLFR
jgi:predicted  nucleic acid-binding Zn-ribbon protein